MVNAWLRGIMYAMIAAYGVFCLVLTVVEAPLNLEMDLLPGLAGLCAALVAAAGLFYLIHTDRLALYTWPVLPVIVGVGFWFLGKGNLEGDWLGIMALILGTGAGIVSFVGVNLYVDQEQVSLILNRLMESDQPISKARSAVRCGASDKLRNDGDGQIWPTEGRLFAPAELRCGPLVVGQTTARTAPRQQTRKAGQTVQYERNLL
ncbi:MAG: hypothetical protein AAF441_16430 [Pseudomonadota bacterium]